MAHGFLPAIARSISFSSIARTAARAQSSISRFVMGSLHVFFAPQGYTTGFKNHEPV